MKKVLMADLMKVEHNVRVLQEAKSLTQKGFDVLVVGFSNKLKVNSNFEIGGVKVRSYFLDDSRKGLQKLQRIFTAVKMILSLNYFIIRYKADVYHAHNFHVLPACYAAAALHRGQLIYDTHESWTIHRNARFHIEHIFAFMIEKIFLRNLSGFITVNEMVAEFYRVHFNIRKSIILYNNRPLIPIVNNDLIRKEYRIAPQKKIAIFVGGFWPAGRPLFEMIESGKFLNENIVIVLMGFGSNTIIGKMKEMISHYSLKDRVILIPPKNPEEVMGFVMSADIGLNLIKRESKAQDFQSPWKLFEYCMGGLAIISTDLPFHKKIYERFDIGLLIGNENSPKQLAEKLNLMTDSEENFIKFKKNARLAAETEFNWGVQEKKLYNLYESIF